MFSFEEIQRRLSIKEIKEPLLEKFIKYVKIETTSDSNNDIDKPSTKCQLDLCKILYEELKNLGINDVTLDEYGFVIAHIPSTPGFERFPSILFNSHVDTSESSSGKNVEPIIHENYNGSIITLPNNIEIDPKNNTILNNCISDTIITSNGSTLLGADDKAGVAAIMTSIEYIIKEKIPHGPIEIMFNTDEEIGKGMYNLNYSKLNSKIGFTVDGLSAPECNFECFNAYSAIITFTGIAIHPGYARNKLVNAILMANHFITLLPSNETPETTDERLGYFYVSKIEGTAEKTILTINIRDFDLENIFYRIKQLELFSKTIESIYKGGKVEIITKKRYHNLVEYINQNPKMIEITKKCYQKICYDLKNILIRGGTDGAALSENGIPSINLFTGANNIHSNSEFLILSHLIASVLIIIEIIKEYTQ